MKFAALFVSLPMLWPLWASAAPPPDSPAPERAGAAQPTSKRKPPKAPVAAGDAQAGELIFYDDEDDDSGWLAPQLSNQVEIHVTGLIARASVAQSFENLSDEVVHATYLFPLPE